MKIFFLLLAAILLISVGCSKNNITGTTTDGGKTLVAKIAAVSDTVITGRAIIFSGEMSKAPLGDPILKYEWSFGDSTSETAISTKHKYNGEGTFIAKLRVTTKSGSVDSTTVTVVVVDYFEWETPTLYLVSSEPQSDGRYKYNFAGLIAAIKGNRDSPFYAGNFSNWTAWSVTATGERYYFFSVTAYNGPIDINYGGRFSDSWADTKYSVFNNPEKKLMTPYLKDGELLVSGQVPMDKVPGDTGDNIVRFSVVGKYLLIYFGNKEAIAGVKDAPFWVSPMASGWKTPENQSLVGSTGWGYVSVPIGDLPDGLIEFKFGGNFKTGSWADMSKSYFWDKEGLCLAAKLIKLDASAKTVAGKPGALWTVVPVK